MQPWLGDPRRVEAALEGESGFLWRVIKRADDEVFTGMTAGTPRQLFIFIGEPLDNFRPRNIRARCRRDRRRPGSDGEAD